MFTARYDIKDTFRLQRVKTQQELWHNSITFRRCSHFTEIYQYAKLYGVICQKNIFLILIHPSEWHLNPLWLIYTGCSESSFNQLTLKLLEKTSFKIQCFWDVKYAPNVVDNNLTTAVVDCLLLTVTGSNVMFPLHVPVISVQWLLGQSVCCGVAGCGHQFAGILRLHPQCCLISLRFSTGTL